MIVTRVQALLDSPATSEAGVRAKPQSKRVFVVHGHDETMRLAVVGVLTKLGLVPVVLHDMPNRGRTIIEKFTDYADVGFAIVLFSPDDMGYPSDKTPEAAVPRARQNVVFEMGYFLGQLGRDRVVALHRVASEFAMPSDYSGVLYTPFDANARWELELVRELRAAEYDVNANDLIQQNPRANRE